jgi:hypothetical protein
MSSKQAYLGAVYTMGLEVVPRSCQICDWLLNLSWDHFGLYQGKNSQSDHEVQGPQKTYFKVYIIYWHGPTGFAVGEAKEVLY